MHRKKPMRRKFPSFRRDYPLMAPHPSCTRVVVCAANKYGDLIIPGPRHWSPTMLNLMRRLSRNTIKYMKTQQEVQGFIDQWGNFMTREEALEVARAAGQLSRFRPHDGPMYMLISEHLY